MTMMVDDQACAMRRIMVAVSRGSWIAREPRRRQTKDSRSDFTCAFHTKSFRQTVNFGLRLHRVIIGQFSQFFGILLLGMKVLASDN